MEEIRTTSGPRDEVTRTFRETEREPVRFSFLFRLNYLI